jgi:phosphotriesterase-related protein
MAVMTVCGEKSVEELGVISPHEHVLIDISNQFTQFPEASRRYYARQKVSISNLDVLSRDPYAVMDNLVMDDAALAEQELLEFKKAGGDTVVDATVRDIGRDPETLRRLSRATGLNLVMGCGYYTQDTHPPEIAGSTVEEIKEEIVRDLTVGAQGTDIRAGVIGEIGTSREIHPDERKVLLAAGKAQRETGVGIIVHVYPWAQNGLEIIKLLTDSGVPPYKIAINHVDVDIDVRYCKRIAETGAFLEFDNFGKEYFIDKRYRGFAGGVFARDIDRVKALKQLIDGGCLPHLFVSCDVCLKTLLHRYGGWGYDHILTHVVPMMREEGIAREQIEAILRENPKKFLDVTG